MQNPQTRYQFLVPSAGKSDADVLLVNHPLAPASVPCDLLDSESGATYERRTILREEALSPQGQHKTQRNMHVIYAGPDEMLAANTCKHAYEVVCSGYHLQKLRFDIDGKTDPMLPMNDEGDGVEFEPVKQPVCDKLGLTEREASVLSDVDDLFGGLIKADAAPHITPARAAMANALVSLVALAFDYCYCTPLKREDIIVCSSCGANKISFHILVNSHVVRDRREAEAFAKYVVKLGENIECSALEAVLPLIDLGIYTDKKGLRLVNCSKVDDPDRVKTIVTGHAPRDTLITATHGCRVLPTECCPGYKAPVPSTQAEVVHLAGDGLGSVQEWIAAHTEFTARGQVGNIIGLRRLSRGMCPVHKREHDHDNGFIMLRKNSAKFYCYRGAADGSETIWETEMAKLQYEKRDNAYMSDWPSLGGDRFALYEWAASVVGAVINGGKLQYVVRDLDPLTGEVGHTIFSGVGRSDLASHEKVVGTREVKGKTVDDIITMYDIVRDLYRGNRITFSRMAFVPQPGVPSHLPSMVAGMPGVYNTWTGFRHARLPPIDPDMERITPMLTHIRESLCAGNAEHYAYVMGWFAHIIQRPATKTNTALVLVGKQGVGKNAWIDFFGRHVIGMRYYCATDDLDSLLAQFNSAFENRLFTSVDESTSQDNTRKRVQQKLKSSITKQLTEIERKYQEKTTLQDFNNFCFMSNHDDCVPIEAGDRRFVVLKCADAFAEGIPGASPTRDAHFARLWATLAADEVDRTAYHMYRYLLTYDLSGWVATKRPQTELYQQMKLDGAMPAVRFLVDFVRGELDEWPLPADGRVREHTKSMYFRFDAWCRVRGAGLRVPTAALFGKDINLVLPTTKPRIDGKQLAGWDVTVDQLRAALRVYFKDAGMVLAPVAEQAEAEANAGAGADDPRDNVGM